MNLSLLLDMRHQKTLLKTWKLIRALMYVLPHTLPHHRDMRFKYNRIYLLFYRFSSTYKNSLPSLVLRSYTRI